MLFESELVYIIAVLFDITYIKKKESERVREYKKKKKRIWVSMELNNWLVLASYIHLLVDLTITDCRLRLLKEKRYLYSWCYCYRCCYYYIVRSFYNNILYLFWTIYINVSDKAINIDNIDVLGHSLSVYLGENLKTLTKQFFLHNMLLVAIILFFSLFFRDVLLLLPLFEIHYCVKTINIAVAHTIFFFFIFWQVK